MTTPINYIPLSEITYGRLLGRGALGDVYEAQLGSSKETVAVKSYEKSSDATKGCHWEYRFLKNIIYSGFIPHGLQVRGIVEGEKHLILDRVPQKNVYRILKDLEWSDIMTISQQLLEFLQVLASQSYVHGDIKVNNLIFEKKSRHLTVIDFSLSFKHRVSLPQPSGFVSPENLLLKSFYDLFGDVWMMGCTIYEMVTKEIFIKSIVKPTLKQKLELNPEPIENEPPILIICRLIGFPSVTYVQNLEKLNPADNPWKIENGSVVWKDETFENLDKYSLEDKKRLAAEACEEVYKFQKEELQQTVSSEKEDKKLTMSEKLTAIKKAIYFSSQIGEVVTSWESTFRQHAKNLQAPNEEVDLLVEILRKIFCYENRANAADLLKYIISKNKKEICFPFFSTQEGIKDGAAPKQYEHLKLKKDETLTILCKSAKKVEYVLRSEGKDEVYRGCLHVPRQSYEKLSYEKFSIALENEFVGITIIPSTSVPPGKHKLIVMANFEKASQELKEYQERALQPINKV